MLPCPLSQGSIVVEFSLRYLAATLALLCVLVAIAVFVHDGFIRHFVGDVLVVVLMFTTTRTFLVVDHKKLVLALVGFSFLVEFGQYVHLVEMLGLERYRLARIVIGSTFDWMDLLAYTMGGGAILLSPYLCTKLREQGGNEN